jgi:eukaryotic-like serine/threonine-protein kinase
MALKTRVWSAGKLLLLGGALLLTYVVFAAASLRIALKTREVEVPPLAGRTVNDARTVLAERGLSLRVDEGLRVDPKVPAGQVLAQEPQAGIRTRRERSVRVWVSAGARSSVVPALIGESERTAQLRAEQEGLRVVAASEIRSADYASGAVVAQTPDPKTRAAEVALLINRGERGLTYVMPDLIGVNGDRAAAFLRARGFRAAVVGEHPYPGVSPGIVLRQSPQAGFQISPGETISLEISR